MIRVKFTNVAFQYLESSCYKSGDTVLGTEDAFMITSGPCPLRVYRNLVMAPQ